MDKNVQVTKKTLRSSTIRVVGVFSFLSFMLVAFLVSTYAWFSSNKEVGATGMQIKVDNSNLYSVVGIDCYPVTAIANGNQYSYIIPPSGYDFGLPVKDPSDIVVSEYKQAMIVHIGCMVPEGKRCELLINAEKPWINNSSMENINSNEDNKKNYLSNVVGFSIGTNNEMVITKTSAELTFVTNVKSSPTKVDSISLGYITSETEDVYIIMEYDQALFEHFSTDAGIHYENVRYYNDIYFEIKEAE